MELRTRAERLLRPLPPTAIPEPSAATACIVSLESHVQWHRWLRGVMCYLVLITYLLSMYRLESYAGNIVFHVFMLLLSLAGELCIYFIYHIKARFSGITNASDSKRRTVNVLHSPHHSRMILEMLLWLIQAPPGLRQGTWSTFLDSLLLLRCYVFVLFFTQHTSRQEFKRIIASLAGCRYDSSFLLRNSYLSANTTPATCAAFIVMWIGLGFLYSKAEGSVSFDRALYVCLTTASFVGYGDIVPATVTGRISLFLSWVVGAAFLGWCVAILYRTTRLTWAERNLYMLFRTNKLCAQVPGEAARTVQRAWKLYKAKRDDCGVLSRQHNAFWLSHQATSFRALRREFVNCEMSFIRSTETFQGTLRTLSPAGTPRRPFSLRERKKGVSTPPSTGSSTIRHPVVVPPRASDEVASVQSPNLDTLGSVHEASQLPQESMTVVVESAELQRVAKRLETLESDLDVLIARVRRMVHRHQRSPTTTTESEMY